MNLPKLCSPFLGGSNLTIDAKVTKLLRLVISTSAEAFVPRQPKIRFDILNLSVLLTCISIGRENLLEDILQVWQDATPRGVMLSGLGGAGKTELSIALVEKLNLQGYVLWLRASHHQTLEQDLITAAEELRHELLRFDASSDPAAAEDRRSSTFYFPPVHVTELVAILKRWLKTQPDGAQRKLLVLDDLDGLDQEQHEKYSMLFSGDAVDLIYTARDPSMADPSMLWEALNFDVPSLQVNDAVKMLERFERHNHSTQGRLDKRPVEDPSNPHDDNVKAAQMTDVATCLGGLPAAVTMGSHYMKDNLASKWNPDSYAEFLDLWAQDDGKRNILESHRATLKYRHSLLASFEVSLHRLRRNIAQLPSHDTLEECCLVLLQLFSALNMEQISRYDIAELRIELRAALSHLQDRPAIFKDPVMEQLLKDLENTLDQCLTEMVKVSLLTERPNDGTLLLNNITKVCALIVLPDTVPLEKKAAIEDSFRVITEHWKPKKSTCIAAKQDNSSPDDPQHREGSGIPEGAGERREIFELPDGDFLGVGAERERRGRRSPGSSRSTNSPLSSFRSHSLASAARDSNLESQSDRERRREKDRRRERDRPTENSRRWSWRRSRTDGEPF